MVDAISDQLLADMQALSAVGRLDVTLVVLTEEILVLRPGPKADFDAFYLLWALTLKIAREQWKRLIFMQTNREDVGQRYQELLIPIAATRQRAGASGRTRSHRSSASDAFAPSRIARVLPFPVTVSKKSPP
jgi:hypothetical protein